MGYNTVTDIIGLSSFV